MINLDYVNLNIEEEIKKLKETEKEQKILIEKQKKKVRMLATATSLLSAINLSARYLITHLLKSLLIHCRNRQPRRYQYDLKLPMQFLIHASYK